MEGENTPVSFEIGPSEHLSWLELKCKDGSPYPSEWRRNRAIILSGVFELIRGRCGNKPIQVLSAYRSPSHNKRVGGATNSQHLHGRALDLRPPAFMNLNDFYKIIKESAKYTALRGIGRYPASNFIHIDVRPSESLIEWIG